MLSAGAVAAQLGVADAETELSVRAVPQRVGDLRRGRSCEVGLDEHDVGSAQCPSEPGRVERTDGGEVGKRDVQIARPLTFAIVGPIAGWAAVRIGERINAVVGGLLLMASMLVFVTVGIDDPTWVIVVALGLSGVAMGMTAPAMAAAIANSVDERDLGVVGGAQQMMSQIGVVAGIQLLVTIQSSRVDEVGLAASFAPAYLVGAIAAGLGALAACFVLPRRRSAVAIPAEVPAEQAELALATAR